MAPLLTSRSRSSERGVSIRSSAALLLPSSGEPPQKIKILCKKRGLWAPLDRRRRRGPTRGAALCEAARIPGVTQRL